MNENNLFRLLFGLVFVIASSLQLLFFLRRIKKTSDGSHSLSLSRLQVILSLLLGIVFGLFLIFYKLF